MANIKLVINRDKQVLFESPAKVTEVYSDTIIRRIDQLSTSLAASLDPTYVGSYEHINRPSVTRIGSWYFDLDHNRPYWWNGEEWV